MRRQQGRRPTPGEISDWRQFAGDEKDAPAERKASESSRPSKRSRETVRKAGSVRYPDREELRLWAEFTGTPMPPDLPMQAVPNVTSEEPIPVKAGQTAMPTAPRATTAHLKNLEIGALVRADPEKRHGGRHGRRIEVANGNVDRKNVDRKIERRLKAGRLEPGRKTDLHGMDRKQAYGVLKRFLQGCHHDGVRLALVVTGKGRGQPVAWHEEEPGVLRRSLPEWLQRPPLAEIVQHFCPAHVAHGGEGAYYVFLKRRRTRRLPEARNVY